MNVFLYPYSFINITVIPVQFYYFIVWLQFYSPIVDIIVNHLYLLFLCLRKTNTKCFDKNEKTHGETTQAQVIRSVARNIVICSKNTVESLDECRRMLTSHISMQSNVDECRRVTKRVQINVHESLNECRQMQTSVDKCKKIKSKKFCWIPEKLTHIPILLLLKLCNSRPHWQTNLQFCSFICDYCSSQCSYFSHQQN